MIRSKAQTPTLIANRRTGGLERLDQRRRVGTNWCVIVVVLIVISFAASCVPIIREGPGVLELEGYLLKDVALGNARFTPVSQENIPLHAAQDYWLKSNDAVEVHWDTLEYRWEKLGATCDFENDAGTEDCQVCNYCSGPEIRGGPPCFGLHLCFAWNVVVASESFDSSSEQKAILEYAYTDTGHTCELLPEPPETTFGPECPNEEPLVFWPSFSGLYQIKEQYRELSETAAETKLYLVEAGTSRTAAYQLGHEIVDGRNYWTWSVGSTNKWRENFSSQLKVTTIRIRKGECVSDPITGQCLAPETSAWAKPSRILFLPNYQGSVSGYTGEANQVCHDDPSARDGFFINLSACRTTNDATPSIVPKFVTPTYEFDPNRSLEPITWLIEFNVNEGGEPIAPGENLIIEFTIQA